MTGGALSKSRISNYEQGLRRLGIEEARLLSKVLGTVSAAYLLCLEGEEPNEQEQELLRCFQETDDRGRETILALARMQCESTVSGFPKSILKSR
jgi:transcriptional regulator with XRE-family HTH domain